MYKAKKFKVGNKNMTVREIIDHPDNVFGINDGQIRGRLASGDRTLKRLLRPLRESVEDRMLADMERVTLDDVPEYGEDTDKAESASDDWTEVAPEWAQSVPKSVFVSDGSTAAYYELPEGARELQDLISYKDMNAQIGEIFRASYRYGEASHSKKLRDAKKMRFYIDAEIERLEKYGDA